MPETRRHRPSRLLIVFLLSVLSMAGSRATAATDPDDRFANVQSTCPERHPLPAPGGRWGVGTLTYHWVDETRLETLTAEPNDLREVIAQLFYPAPVAWDGRTIAYVPELETFRAALSTDSRATPRKIALDLGSYACVETHSKGGAPFAEIGGVAPVVLISSGGNMSRHWHTSLAESLASEGYLVAVLSHAHSGMDIFPAGGFLMSHPRWNLPDDTSEKEARRIDDELSDLLAGDARFVLDRIAALDGHDPDDRFTGRIDLDRVAILGHSRGGKTVSRACSADARFDACVIYDNIGPERERDSGLRQPQMTIRRPWPEGQTAALHGYLSKNKAVAYEVVIEGASHFSFSDLPLVDPENYSTDIEPVSASGIVRDYTLAFLARTLRGDDSDSLLAGTQSGAPVVAVRVFVPKS